MAIETNGQPAPQPVATYGIVVNVLRFADDRASAEVAMVYGPLLPVDVATLLRGAAARLEAEHGIAEQHHPRRGLYLPSDQR